MARTKGEKGCNETAFPLRLTRELRADAQACATLLGVSESDFVREAIELHVRRIRKRAA